MRRGVRDDRAAGARAGDLVYYVPLVGGGDARRRSARTTTCSSPAGSARRRGRRRLREAIAVATPSASRAITVAGITLAATFALLALVPLLPFRQLALLMALGVLIDALFVRPLLIPALIALGRPRDVVAEPPARPGIGPRAGRGRRASGSRGAREVSRA